jgi:SAM-dependent methyltransferase
MTVSDPLSAALDRWPSRPNVAFVRALEAACYPTTMPMGCVDLGCGRGEFAEVLGLVAAIAVDSDAMALRGASQSSRYVGAIQSDIVSLPFASGTVRNIVCNSVLEHVVDDVSATREIARILAPGGHLWITVPSDRKEDGLFYGSADHGDAAASYRVWFSERYEHRHYHSSEQWCELLGSEGLDVVALRGYEGPTAGRVTDALGHVGVEFPPVPFRTQPRGRRAIRCRAPAACPRASLERRSSCTLTSPADTRVSASGSDRSWSARRDSERLPLHRM